MTRSSPKRADQRAFADAIQRVIEAAWPSFTSFRSNANAHQQGLGETVRAWVRPPSTWSRKGKPADYVNVRIPSADRLRDFCAFTGADPRELLGLGDSDLLRAPGTVQRVLQAAIIGDLRERYAEDAAVLEAISRISSANLVAETLAYWRRHLLFALQSVAIDRGARVVPPAGDPFGVLAMQDVTAAIDRAMRKPESETES